MARRVTEKDIVKINRLYKKIGTYAGVARETGFSPSTVKRYVIPDFHEVDIKKKVHKDAIAKEGDWEEKLKGYTFAELCLLNLEETDELIELRKELMC